MILEAFEVERSGTKKASKKSAVTPTASLRGAEQGSFFRVSALFCCCSKWGVLLIFHLTCQRFWLYLTRGLNTKGTVANEKNLQQPLIFDWSSFSKNEILKKVENIWFITNFCGIVNGQTELKDSESRGRKSRRHGNRSRFV